MNEPLSDSNEQNYVFATVFLQEKLIPFIVENAETQADITEAITHRLQSSRWEYGGCLSNLTKQESEHLADSFPSFPNFFGRSDAISLLLEFNLPVILDPNAIVILQSELKYTIAEMEIPEEFCNDFVRIISALKTTKSHEKFREIVADLLSGYDSNDYWYMLQLYNLVVYKLIPGIHSSLAEKN